MTASKGSAILSPRKETIDELKRKYPDIDKLLKDADIAGSVYAITSSEAEYIVKFSPDTFRNRVAKAKRERLESATSGSLGTSATAKNDLTWRPYAPHSRFTIYDFRLIWGFGRFVYLRPWVERMP